MVRELSCVLNSPLISVEVTEFVLVPNLTKKLGVFRALWTLEIDEDYGLVMDFRVRIRYLFI